MDLFSKKELLIMAIVVSSLLLVIVYLTILDIRDYLHDRKRDRVKNFDSPQNEEVKPEMIAGETVPPVGSMTELLEEIEVIEVDDSPSVLERVAIKNEPNVELEPVNGMSQQEAKQELAKIEMELVNLNNKDPFEDTITNFELEQEENAIISLDELVKVSNSLYDNNESVQYDDGNEPITIDEVINKYNNVESIDSENASDLQKSVMPSFVDGADKTIIYSNIEPVKKESHPYEKVESVPFISSLYGLEKTSNEMEFENTANYEKLDQEIRKTNEFLNSLKEMHERNGN